MPISRPARHQTQSTSAPPHPRDGRCAALLRRQEDLAEAERIGAPKVIHINIDDSIGKKDKDTRRLEPVDGFFDPSEGSYKNGFCYVVCTMRVGPNVATLDLQLYLREKTVRRLNRERPKEKRLPFRSKYRIARQILVELAPLLPKGWKVYVQFDS